MPVYRQIEPRLGRQHIKEWRRRAVHSCGLLLLILAICGGGLAVLDPSSAPFSTKFFRGLWNGINLVTTLGDFTLFDDRQKLFMSLMMLVFVIIGGFMVAQLTGLLSSNAVLALKENRTLEHRLEHLANHVIVIGFGPLGQLVAQKLQAAGENVVIIERLDELAAQASELGYLVVQADAGIDDEALKRSCLDKAKALVVTIEDVDRKVAVTLMAHSLNSKLKIAVTGANHQRGTLLQRAGASEVIIAEDLIANALVGRLGYPLH